MPMFYEGSGPFASADEVKLPAGPVVDNAPKEGSTVEGESTAAAQPDVPPIPHVLTGAVVDLETGRYKN